jgi:hypothetical protein
MDKKDIFIEMNSGRIIFPYRQRTPDEFDIHDIAHHLSLINRYNGATRRPYSVAEHCIILASFAEFHRNLPSAACLNYLMHDAAEAYCQDIVGPFQSLAPELRRLHDELQPQILRALGVPEMDVETKLRLDYDDLRIVINEREHLHPNHRPGNLWRDEEARLPGDVFHCDLSLHSWEDVRDVFLRYFEFYKFAIN